MQKIIDKEKRAGKQRIAMHIYTSRRNRGKPISMEESMELVDEVFNAMYLALANGFTVYFSNFGSLTPVRRSKRVVRNPKTGEQKVISPANWVKWRPAPRLRDVVNGRTKVFTVKKRGKTGS